MKPQYVTRILNQLALGGGERMLSNIVEMEQARGFKVVRPGEIEWFSQREWKPSSIISLHGNRVRIVLLEAKQQRNGAFRRLLNDVEEMQLVPVVVEPHDRLAVTLSSWGWKHRRHGADETAETIWYPRKGLPCTPRTN